MGQSVDQSTRHMRDGAHQVIPAIAQRLYARITSRPAHDCVVIGQADDLGTVVNDVEIAALQKRLMKRIRKVFRGKVEDRGCAASCVLQPVANHLFALEREIGELKRAFYKLCHGTPLICDDPA